MKNIFLLFISLAAASAFVIQPQTRRYGTSMSMVMPDSPVSLDQASVVSKTFDASNYVEQQKISSVNYYLQSSNVLDSTSNIVSLKDRPPPPTKEEIAEKQRNFNFWFWGGGFVAPFLATFYYFGFKFWER